MLIKPRRGWVVRDAERPVAATGTGVARAIERTKPPAVVWPPATGPAAPRGGPAVALGFGAVHSADRNTARYFWLKKRLTDIHYHGKLVSHTAMEDTRDELLRAAIRVCLEHGLDRPAFVELMRAGFDVGITRPEQTLACHLTRFLFASLQWAVPPETAEMRCRRKEAARSWACAKTERARH